MSAIVSSTRTARRTGLATRILDSHVHAISADRARYPRFEPDQALAVKTFGVASLDLTWADSADNAVDPLMHLLSSCGVHAAVLVQPYTIYGNDNSYVIHAASSVSNAVAVPIVPWDAPPAEVAALASVVAGYRTISLPRDLPESGHGTEVLETLESLRLPMVLTAHGGDLITVKAVTQRFPGVQFVLDHCGLSDGVIRSSGEAREMLTASGLDEQPNVVAKFSNLLMRDLDDPATFVADLVRAWGANRVMWGSDYPHVTTQPYPTLVAAALDACSELTEEIRDQVLCGTALSVFPQLCSAYTSGTGFLD